MKIQVYKNSKTIRLEHSEKNILNVSKGFLMANFLPFHASSILKT